MGGILRVYRNGLLYRQQEERHYMAAVSYTHLEEGDLLVAQLRLDVVFDVSAVALEGTGPHRTRLVLLSLIHICVGGK